MRTGDLQKVEESGMNLEHIKDKMGWILLNGMGMLHCFCISSCDG